MSAMLVVAVLTVVIFGLAMLLMSIGVIVKGRTMPASCGGGKAIDPDGRLIVCDHCTCSNPQDS